MILILERLVSPLRRLVVGSEQVHRHYLEPLEKATCSVVLLASEGVSNPGRTVESERPRGPLVRQVDYDTNYKHPITETKSRGDGSKWGCFV